MTDLAPASPTRPGRVARIPGLGDAAPTLETWQDAPFNRWTLAHVEEFVPTVSIAARARDAVAASTGSLDELLPGLDARMQASYTDALLVLHRGAIVGEWYAPGFAPTDRHLLMSVSKSICGLVIGTLVDDGRLDVHAPIASIVPELEGTAYGDATVQHVLDMTVDVDYDEDYRNPASHVRAQDRVAGWRERLDGDARDTYAFLRSLRGGGRHGERFLYCSAGTDVLAWVIESVTGIRYHEAVAQRLWSRLGAEHDATITVDSGGFAFANGGISCTARDLARVGAVMLGDGSLDGERIVSREWVRDTLAGGDPDAARGSIFQRVHPDGSYRNQWWSTGNDRGNVYAVGIHGQYVWVDEPSNTVIVKFSSWPDAVTEEWNRVHARLFHDVCEALER